MHTHPKEFVGLHVSYMVLDGYFDAAYLVLLKGRFRIPGYHYFSSNSINTKSLKVNWAIFMNCKTLQHVVLPAAEAKLADVYYNVTQTIVICKMLEVLGHL